MNGKSDGHTSVGVGSIPIVPTKQTNNNMTSKTKKILVYVCTALLLAGVVIGIVSDVVPTHDNATVESVEATVDSVAVDSIA